MGTRLVQRSSFKLTVDIMNKRIKAAIVDDEKGSIDALLWELENYKDQVEVIEAYQDPMKALGRLKDIDIDLLFLDIAMPKLNGFELLQSMGPIDFSVIFTTAYDEFAIRAFEVNAVDYLLKPVSKESLARALDKIQNENKLINLEEKLNRILHDLNHPESRVETVVFPTSEGLEFIEASQIIRCESSSNYCFIHRSGEKPLLISKTLKEVEGILSHHGFYRVHQSHLVNIRSIKKYLKGKAGSLVLKDDSVIPVSRNKKGDFLDRL